MAKLILSSDLYKGLKLDKRSQLGGAVDDILPFQMLNLEDKTLDWIKSVADYYDICGWRNVEKKATKIQRNFDMRYGKITPSDYIIDPNVNPFSQTVGMILPEQESKSPLQQFYPLAPNFVDVMRGEFIKMDHAWTIEAIDPLSVTEVFSDKKDKFEQIILQYVQTQKQQELEASGLSPKTDQQQYDQAMKQAMDDFSAVEAKSKTFRTTGVLWAEKVLKIHEKRHNLFEKEADSFDIGLTTDSEFWHLDMMDDDFEVRVLNPKWCDHHKGPNVKYVSEGDYFLWFDFMSAGDIVNKYGRRMQEEDILKLKDIYVKTGNLLIPDSEKAIQGAYYDHTKNWTEATSLNPAMNDSLLGKELAYSYTRSPNFDHNIDVDIFNPVWGRLVTGHPQMFRVMRLYWRSMMRVGWLTKINRDGTREQPEWIDENYKVTVEPQYDNSIVKTKTKDNLIYGEHIDWTWAPQWRHVMKISPNAQHSYWMNPENSFTAVYIDGGPVPFQFKGRKNPFESLPPVEGCNFSWINSTAHSFIDRIRPLQIIYNICMNKVPKKFLSDFGNKLAIHRGLIPQNNSSNVGSGLDPMQEYEDKLRDSEILDFTYNREAMEGMGQPPLPHVLQLSTVQEAQFYFSLGQQIKMEAGEIIGISRQRLGKNMASETASGIDQSIQYSETQTAKYYEDHSNLMQRVRQRMLDLAQYYSTFNESSRDTYMNDMNETVMLQVEGMDNLMPHYNIYLQSRANVRAALQKIEGILMSDNTLQISSSSRIEAVISNSLPHILNTIKTAELQQAQNEQAQQQAEQEHQKAILDQQQQMEAANRDHDDHQKDLDRQTQVEVAAIRALGGKENSVAADLPNVENNLDGYFRQQELKDKRQESSDKLINQRQIETDKMILAKEIAQKKLEGEKYRADKSLEIAKENTRKNG